MRQILKNRNTYLRTSVWQRSLKKAIAADLIGRSDLQLDDQAVIANFATVSVSRTGSNLYCGRSEKLSVKGTEERIRGSGLHPSIGW
ncbi:hypothetical protein INP83_11375 [Mucilaginibacter sp. 21P]|uniref:hypothetical protein n=1 Tax=Mucilaginibacter sp. 21P TaxID=2778902 RepID=UPI001C570811|nr:hypothetical protein [Mucilaginibacter sp. 21P]QXV63710.1 hypothetical protein INP83_11375 [Mucilaginibacter sp. 21P]